MNDEHARTWMSRRLAVTVVAAAVGACWRAASGAPGDLDPAFADAGLLFGPGVDFSGPAWSIEPQSETEFVVAGGVSGTFDDGYALGFVGRLLADGTRDPAFAAHTSLMGREIRDIAVQPDGKIVAVGRAAGPGFRSYFLVFRLDRDGAFDSAFGIDGQVLLAARAPATSVSLDPDGHIVVAGTSLANLMVARLTSNGARDEAFAVGLAGAGLGGSRTAILRTAGGGYRLFAHDSPDGFARCRVLALTASGTVDEGFGDRGYATLGLPAKASTSCRSMAQAADGRLLVVGARDDHAFAIRLTSGGDVDPVFDSAGIAATMAEATAVAIDGDDSVVVAGQGRSDEAGAMVARLRTDGSLDDLFGNAGTTWIDPANVGSGFARANDLAILPGGDILVAGGAINTAGGYGPFVARLVANSSRSGAGWLGFSRPRVELAQDTAQVALAVRRMGGRSGAVSVSYRTRAPVESEFPASEGGDYIATSGQLEWADGDAGDRQIHIPIVQDDGSLEERETFEVELYDLVGGAGMGTRIATVAIAADGAPGGLLSLQPSGSSTLGEAEDYAQVVVQRNYYSGGSISVTVTPVASTAVPGQDFAGEPVTVSWSDGETDDQIVNIPLEDDAIGEPTENFTVQLTDATGGAVIGPRSTMTFTITDDDTSGAPGGSGSSGGSGPSGGGGWLDWLAILLLGAAGTVRTGGRRASVA